MKHKLIPVCTATYRTVMEGRFVRNVCKQRQSDVMQESSVLPVCLCSACMETQGGHFEHFL